MNYLYDRDLKFDVMSLYPKSFFGFDYTYQSESEDEDKYITKNNKNFSLMKKKKKLQHIMELWRRCFNRAMGCIVLINLFLVSRTKMIYFGRQLISK